MIKMLRNLAFILLPFFIIGQISAQNNPISTKPQIVFQATEFQQYGFDAYKHVEWKDYYDTLPQTYLPNYVISYKSVGYDQSDEVNAVFQNKRAIEKDSLEFTIDGRFESIRFIQKNDSTFTLFLPKKKGNYSISARYKRVKFGQLNVVVYAQKNTKVILVPLMDVNLNKDSIIDQLNAIYNPANINLRLDIRPVFKPKVYSEQALFDNPSPTNDRYTSQMQEIRNAYFDTYPTADRSAYYIFIVPGFVNPEINGYMVLNKAVGFVKLQSERKLGVAIARDLGHGMGILSDSWSDGGPQRGSTDNLMDENGGILLTKWQWDDIRHSAQSFSFYDNYEDVRTNNGIVAYYFWKEDKNGNIVLDNEDLLSAIKKPYKKNFMSYHLDIRDFFYQTLFTVRGYMVSLWHIIAFVLVVLLTFFVQYRFNRFIQEKLRRARILKFFSRLGFFSVACGIYVLCFILINQGYQQFEVRSGLLKELNRQSSDQAIKTILVNQNVRHKAEDQLSSEVLVKRMGSWYVKKRKKVLYFELMQDENKKWTKCRYKGDSDSLVLVKHNFREKAESHYLVFNYIGEDSSYQEQKVYNHLGIDLTTKLDLGDPAKRLLIFVNGYRPTSIGHTFEDNFKNIKKRGLEYPNSGNMIYNFDRYDYWRPWNQIDLLFQKRINPSETYYADGHFSVTTSNHETLINFTTVSTIYPKRCKNKNKHTCYNTTITSSGIFGAKTKKTIDLHRTKSNKKGFKVRYNNGRIAGRNLLQLFNELPNKSSNDTLYLVAHSMGYAYALGMIEELRGQINFGGFYILAPENASAGKVKISEWKEVWQYGSNFNPKKHDAPCLLDGVAPQTIAGGLTPKHRSYIPDHLFKKKGFFDSHFIGYYTWIFGIEEGQIGCVHQH
jgi:hypothetical protein